MSVRPVIVAAALLGAFAASFLLTALAFASGSHGSAVVTLQIAPRGLGTVSVDTVRQRLAQRLLGESRSGLVHADVQPRCPRPADGKQRPGAETVLLEHS